MEALSNCLILPSGSVHETCQGKRLGGTPLAFAQTVSPKLKSVLGVVQSDAKVEIPSGDGGDGKKSGDDNWLDIVELVALRAVTLFELFDWEVEPVGEELERAE